MLIAGTTNAPISKKQKSEINDATTLGWPSASPDALFCASSALLRRISFTVKPLSGLAVRVPRSSQPSEPRNLITVEKSRYPSRTLIAIV